MKVTKRDGTTEDINFNKIATRIKRLTNSLSSDVSGDLVAQKVMSSLYDGIGAEEIDTLSAETAIALQTDEPDYEKLAARLTASNIQKRSPPTFMDAMKALFKAKILAPDVWDSLKSYERDDVNSIIKKNRDSDINFFGLKTLERGYLTQINSKLIETPQYLFLRVAWGIHNNIEDAKETYNMMSQGYFIHATPTLFNSGTIRPQMSSCFLKAMDEDSIDGIFETIKKVGKISKWSGGIGLHAHNIRANKSHIEGTNGTSDGIIPMLRVLNATARYVNQGGKRKGSVAVYLEPWHADILQFLDLRLNQGDEEARCRDLFTALWIPDAFMERVRDGKDWHLFCPNEVRKAHGKCLSDVYGEEFEELYSKCIETPDLVRKTLPAEALWKSIVRSQIETGTPYMLYKDACNKKSNQKNIGIIKSSNLCVAPETKVLTEEGQFEIKELEGQQVSVWNGEEFSETTIIKTGENQKLIRVHTGAGDYIDCTPYHKFHIETASRPADKSVVKIIDAQNLKKGMKIIRHSLPVIRGKGDMKYAYTHGMFCADGTYANNKPILDLYGKKKELLKNLDWRSFKDYPQYNKMTLRLPLDMPRKFEVPINKSLETRLAWLAGYVDGDGCVINYKGIKNIQVASIHKDFLNDIRLMLQGMGCYSVVKLMRDAETQVIKGQAFECKPLWRLGIDADGIRLLASLGFSPKRLDVSNCRVKHHKTNPYIKIEAIEDMGRYDDTYCFTEPKRHTGMFNGILTGQCTEILEVSNKDETAVCNLASIALPKYVDQKNNSFNYSKLESATRMLVRNLNKVIDKNYYPTDCAKHSNMLHRPIGLGVQGLADVFMLLGHPFDSHESREINKLIFEHIYYAAVSESMELAKKDGAYEQFKGSPLSEGKFQFDLWGVEPSLQTKWDKLRKDVMEHGVRNSLLVAPMPTASTSQILGNNECFEPYTTNIYLRRTLAGEFVVINKHLVKTLKEMGMWNKHVKDGIIRSGGSIQGFEGLGAQIKDVFKTVWEISQKCIIDMAADRGAFVDQSQSMNLFLESPTMSKISSMHMYAWQKGLKTGMYYLRSKAKSRPIQFTLEPCETCSA